MNGFFLHHPLGRPFLRNWRLVALGLAVTMAATLASGCGQGRSQSREKKAVEVMATTPITEEVTEYQDFTGRLMAIKMINLRARVTGYVMDASFREGDEVQAGQVLFKIDPQSYAADLHLAEANLKLAIADSHLQERLLARAEDLHSRHANSQEEYETALATWQKSQATVAAMEATRDRAKLYVDYTQVIAPVSGRISQRLVDPGNMAVADQTILTTIVTENPMYAYFDVDERTYLDLVNSATAEQRLWYSRLRSPVHPALGAGMIGLGTSPQGTSPFAALAGLITGTPRFPILMRLTTENDYTHLGVADFVDNQINANTGTVRMRGIFKNPQQTLKAGLFVRVRLPIGQPNRALLISDEALQSDQGRKFLYVLNGKNEPERRYVQLGQSVHGLRVIKEGLAKGERVIVIGQQRVREGVAVQVKMQDPPKHQPSPLTKMLTLNRPHRQEQPARQTRKPGNKLAQ